MKKTKALGVVLGMILSMSSMALAECPVCGGDGLCNTCNGLGFLMAEVYGSKEMIRIACMDENCNQGVCRACEKVSEENTLDSESDEMIQKAQNLYQAEEYEAAFAMYEKLALQDSSEGMYWLGVMYSDGEGVEQDYGKAYEWFIKAAEKGNTSAMNNIAFMYLEGRGLVQDDQEAAKWLEKSANLGDAHAMDNLGGMYALGRGVQKDYDSARVWYECAISAGNMNAMNNLGGLYSTGSGVEKDLEMAFELYEKAAVAGNIPGMKNTAYVYKIGQGVEKNLEKAYEWYKKAADAGDEEAQKALKELLLEGYNVETEKGGLKDSEVERMPAETEDARIPDPAPDSSEQFKEDGPFAADMEEFLAASGYNTLDALKEKERYNSGTDIYDVMFDAKDGETLIHPCFVMIMTEIATDNLGNLKHQELFLEAITELLAVIYEEQAEVENGKLPYNQRLGSRLSMGGAQTEEIIKNFDGITFPALGNWKITDTTDVLLFACYDEKQNAYMEDNRYLLIRYKLEDSVTFCQLETNQAVVNEFLDVMRPNAEENKDSEESFLTQSEGDLQILYPKNGMIIYPENGEFTVKWCWGDQQTGGNLKMYSEDGVVYENKQKILANVISMPFYKEEFVASETYTFELMSNDQSTAVEFMITDDPLKASRVTPELRILHPRNGQVVEYSSTRSLSFHWYMQGVEDNILVKLLDEEGNTVMEDEQGPDYEAVQLSQYLLESGKTYTFSVSCGEMREEVRFTAVETEPDETEKPVAHYLAPYEGKDNVVQVLVDGYNRTFAKIERNWVGRSTQDIWYRYADTDSETIMRPSILVLRPGLSALNPGDPKAFMQDIMLWLYVVNQTEKDGLADEQRDYSLPYREGIVDYMDYGSVISAIAGNPHENSEALVFGLIDHDTGMPLENTLYMLMRFQFTSGSTGICLCTDQEIIKAYVETAEYDLSQSIWAQHVQWLNETQQASVGQVRVRKGTSINVRERASADSRLVGTAQSGGVYPCLSVEDNGWCQIVLEDGTVGYVSGKLVSIVK